MKRRNFLHAVSAGALSSWFGLRSRQVNAALAVSFDHGVASGDPRSDAVIIWTRVSGLADAPVQVLWMLSRCEDFSETIQSGSTWASPRSDYTVKIDVRDLPAGATLYYRFECESVQSPSGRTRTLPDGSASAASFAVVSCSSYPTGYFHAYRDIAERDDLDAVLHLGDFIYEYGNGEYATEYAEELGRVPEPPHEIVSLEDYRRRHAQYRGDVDCQAMLARHPLIAVWDDHELTNDTWRAGAQNHQDDEGRFLERINAAVRAYLEWMPVRASRRGNQTQIFREFRYGDLASLIMLDTRLYGRDLQPDVGPEVNSETVTAALRDPERRLLGRRQEGWLERRLDAAAGTTWQVIGQQVMVSQLLSPDLEPLVDPDREAMVSKEFLERAIAMSKSNPPMLLDTWDGYPVARHDFLTALSDKANNAVVLSGDLHTSMAGNLPLTDAEGNQEIVAVEFMATSVTSPGFADYLPERHPGAIRDASLKMNPALQYMDTDRRGWMHIRLTHNDCIAEWHLLDGVRDSYYTSVVDRRLGVTANDIAAGIYPV